eukprot:483271-Prorocentrum_minimum.AAC.2
MSHLQVRANGFLPPLRLHRRIRRLRGHIVHGDTQVAVGSKQRRAVDRWIVAEDLPPPSLPPPIAAAPPPAPAHESAPPPDWQPSPPPPPDRPASASAPPPDWPPLRTPPPDWSGP